MCDLNETEVAYITRNRSVSNNTHVGLIVVNFLINTKTDPQANVIAVDTRGEHVSMYSYSLMDSIGSTGLKSIMLSKTVFVNDEDKFISLEALRSYLDGLNPRHFEEEMLYEKVLYVLGTSTPKLAVRDPRVGSDTVRDSFLISPAPTIGRYERSNPPTFTPTGQSAPSRFARR